MQKRDLYRQTSLPCMKLSLFATSDMRPNFLENKVEMIHRVLNQIISDQQT
jgi:hypothetical protein